MIFRLIQLAAWCAKSTLDYFLLRKVCRFKENRLWMIALRILLNAELSFSIWTIHGLPFWLAWPVQVFWDLVMILNLRRRKNSELIRWPHLVFAAALESGWILAICIFWKWSASLFVHAGSPSDVITGMCCSLILGTLQFGAVTRLKPEYLDRKLSVWLAAMITVNVVSAQIFIDQGARDQYFCLITGVYSTLLIMTSQYVMQRKQLRQKEEKLVRTQAVIEQASTDLEKQNDQLREIRHSLKSHLRILQVLNSQNQAEEIEQYLKNLVGECEEYSFTIYCKDPILNALFNQITASYPSIHFDLLIEPEIKIIPDGLAEALFLGIDNAAEELIRHPDLPQMVTVSMRRNREDFVCTVCNPLSVCKSLRTEKSEADHGLGLIRIRKKIAQLDGSLAISQDSQFILTMKVPADRGADLSLGM